jgi:hypothetical protein
MDAGQYGWVVNNTPKQHTPHAMHSPVSSRTRRTNMHSHIRHTHTHTHTHIQKPICIDQLPRPWTCISVPIERMACVLCTLYQHSIGDMPRRNTPFSFSSSPANGISFRPQYGVFHRLSSLWLAFKLPALGKRYILAWKRLRDVQCQETSSPS